MNEWLTLQEASKITGKSASALRRLIQRGQYERIKKERGKQGEYWLIHQDEISGTDVHDRTERTGVQKQCSEGVQVNVITFETFIQQQKEWSSERERIMNGLMMYQFKFEEMDRRLKLLPAPPEVIENKFKEQEIALLKIQEKLSCEETTRKALKKSLQEAQDAREEVLKEKDEALHLLNQTKDSEKILQQEKEKITQESNRLKAELDEARKPWWKKILKTR